MEDPAAGMVDRLSPIDRRLKTEWPLRKAAEKTADAAACASGGAIGDNSSTMEDPAAGMVDRLSPIDRRLKTEWPLRKAAEKTADSAACASGRAIGDNSSAVEDGSDKRLFDRS